jgi:triacylglycerol lipase
MKMIAMRPLLAALALGLNPLACLAPTALAASPQAYAAGPRRNDCPVILVHGILGFGQDQRLLLSAWGGAGDYRRTLADEGRRIFSATIGPVSSNWDRACELFAYIKGGLTDYGASHSARCGHARFGREYPGVHPSWGSEDRVHLLCHSMGGQTARLLVQLLEEGASEELEAAPRDASPLFSGGKSWVLGIVTLCSPHDGSSLSLVTDYGSAAAKKAICAFIAYASPAYDARLDQWGLERREGEGAAAYAARLAEDVSWYLGEDACYRDLRPSGAAELNGWVKARPDVCYFSWAASDTREAEGRQLPGIGMQPLLAASSRAMGSFEGSDGPWAIGPAWRENDGTVNTVSMDGPALNSSDLIVPFSGTPLLGAWNFMGTLAGTDHVDLLGFATPPWYSPPGFDGILDWYRYNLDLLASL